MERIKFLTSDVQIESMIQKELGLKVSDTYPFDLIYSNYPSSNLLPNQNEQIHNNSMLLLTNIHSTKSNSVIWEALKQNQVVTVSIDMFYCGALFFRKEQVKEHFKIRI